MGSSVATESSTVTCRRCARPYLIAQRSRWWFVGCPHCGKSPAPLLRDNRVAAVLSAAALVLLIWALNAPFVGMRQLGEVRTFSLVGGIEQLYRDGQPIIATVLLVFSVLFPIAKLLSLLVATSSLVPLSGAGRKKLHWLATITGKYSLLDLIVVAIIIVLVKFRSGFAEAFAMGGTTIFCIAIVCSILAGFAVKLDPPAASGERLRAPASEDLP